MGLRREAARVEHHEAAHHGVHAQGEDHRGHAQVGDAEAVHDADREPHREAHGDRQRPAHGAGQHGAGGQGPGHGEVDVAQQDDEHHAGRDDAQEGADLELLEEVGWREEARLALGPQRVDRAQRQDDEDEAAGDDDRAVLGREPQRHYRHPKSSRRFLIRKTRAAPRLTAPRSTTPSKSG